MTGLAGKGNGYRNAAACDMYEQRTAKPLTEKGADIDCT